MKSAHRQAALAAPTAPESVAWLRAGAGLYCGYQTCEVGDENGFPVYRHPPATAPFDLTGVRRSCMNTLREALKYLHTLLNSRLNAAQMLAAEKEARDWLVSIGSEPP